TGDVGGRLPSRAGRAVAAAALRAERPGLPRGPLLRAGRAWLRGGGRWRRRRRHRARVGPGAVRRPLRGRERRRYSTLLSESASLLAISSRPAFVSVSISPDSGFSPAMSFTSEFIELMSCAICPRVVLGHTFSKVFGTMVTAAPSLGILSLSRRGSFTFPD